MVDHKIVTFKSKNYRVDGNDLNWLKYYLVNHKMYLKIHSQNTSIVLNTCDMP